MNSKENYLKYRKYDTIIMSQIISIKTSYTVNVLLFFTFFERTSRLYKKNLSNSSTNFGLGIKQTEF